MSASGGARTSCVSIIAVPDNPERAYAEADKVVARPSGATRQKALGKRTTIPPAAVSSLWTRWAAGAEANARGTRPLQLMNRLREAASSSCPVIDFVACSSEAVDSPDDENDIGVETDDATTTSTMTTTTAPAPAAKVQMSAMLKWPAAARPEGA